MTHEGAPVGTELIDPNTVAPQQFEDLDKPQEECGVIGIWSPAGNVAQLIYKGLKALQHRGQTGAGMSLNDKKQSIVTVKGVGLVDAAVPEAILMDNGESMLDVFHQPVSGNGHTRYSTAENNMASQPFAPSFSLAHNGHIEDMANIALDYGVDIENGVSDSHLLAETLHAGRERLNGNLDAALAEVLPKLEGAYCLTISDDDRTIGVRDPWGFHPLVLGQRADGGKILASETSVLDALDATFVRDIEKGEIVSIDATGVTSSRINRVEDTKRCMFEFKYIARPSSRIDGVNVGDSRIDMGRYLALQEPVDADIVVGVPDTGMWAAEGYSQVSGIPRAPGIQKNPGVMRSFLERGDRREAILRQKFLVNALEVEGMRLVLVDDSVIKGNTMRILIDMLRENGVAEVHLRSAGSRYMNPCFMGMDTRETARLIARDHSDEEIASIIGADSVAFNRVRDIERATRSIGELCTACTTGDYPFSEGTFSDLEYDTERPNVASLPNRTLVRI